ncbi:MAG: type III PLP-dependent enzyme [Myxococcales bacterium FL481]|nr:MAG: type III PLP-dependent enzyme [Myxococcales bacterium FL481]
MKALLRSVLEQYPTPCFVLDLDAIDQRLHDVDAAFRGVVAPSYAIKANPNPLLLAHLSERLRFVDVSSAGELRRVLAAGFEPGAVSFTGPGKRDEELAFAVETGVDAVVLESLGEARRLERIAGHRATRQRVMLRISPAELAAGFGAQMSGRATAFGVDQEQLVDVIPELVALPHLDLIGFHVFAGAQCLRGEAITSMYLGNCAVFREAIGLAQRRPQRLVFGSGLGIPYHANERPLDLTAIAASTLPELSALAADSGATLLLETGRYLVGEAGHYLTTVVDIKQSRGARFCICDGGMHHNLAAAGLFGMVIPKNYPFTLVGRDATGTLTQQLVGPLCTSLDTMGRSVDLPELRVGDVIAMGCVGAYGVTASPVHFISHPAPTEVVGRRAHGGFELRSESALTSQI